MDKQLNKLIGSGFGFKLHPIVARGKKPILDKWVKRGSNDKKQITAWEKQYPRCNWGLVTGAVSGVFVVDIDPKNNGEDAWKKLCGRKQVPDTTKCKTGSGGFHLYFNIPDFAVSNARLIVGVDIRGNNGQVVIPPSTHPNGTQYAWENPPWLIPPADAPAWLVTLLREKQAGDDAFVALGSDVPSGTHNDTLFHYALMLSRQGASTAFVKTTLQSWQEEKLDTGTNDFTDRDINTIIASAFKRVAKENDKKAQEKNKLTKLKTDADNAARFIQQHDEKVRYVHGMGWHIWNERLWQPDEDEAMTLTLAIDMMTEIRAEALEDARDPAMFKEAIQRASWANGSLNIGRLKSMTTLASKSPDHRLHVDDFDSFDTLHLLNVKNGIVDMKTGKLLPHDPKLQITRYIDVDYEPNAKCSFWMRTLELSLDHNEALINYMQRAVGYSLTGSVSEQCMFICHGESGNNGKSTIIETLQRIMGTYVAASDIRVIASQEVNLGVQSSVAKLPAVRMVNVSEADANHKLSEAFVKQITGGDTVQACKKFQDPFEFVPQFKLWLRTNDKPQIRGTSNAIWRRIKLIPFEKEIPAKDRMRRDDVDAKLKSEYAGILNWCIKGAVKWYADGLQDPDEVSAAVAGYRTDMDIVAQFCDECVIEDAGKSVGRSDLYQVFTIWAKENGYRIYLSSKMFAGRMKMRLGNTERTMVKGKYVWIGVDLADHAKTYMF